MIRTKERRGNHELPASVFVLYAVRWGILGLSFWLGAQRKREKHRRDEAGFCCGCALGVVCSVCKRVESTAGLAWLGLAWLGLAWLGLVSLLGLLQSGQDARRRISRLHVRKEALRVR